MMQVLVATGESSMRESIRLALESAGYRVREAETGIAALTVMAASEHPLVVVLDAQLPDLDGLQVLRFAETVLHAGWRAGMVLISAEAKPLVLGDEWDAGAWLPQVLTQPISLDVLVTAVRIAAARQRAVVRRTTRSRAPRARRAVALHNGVGAGHHG